MTRTVLDWTDDAGGAGALEFDAVTLYGFEAVAEVTEHPVEQGTAITDHVRPQNGTVTLEGVITNAPIVLPATQMDGNSFTPGVVTLSDGTKVTAQRWTSPVDRVRACDAVLEALVADATLVSITTGLRTVDSLAVSRYRCERNDSTGAGAVRVTLELKRVRIATTQRVPVPAVRRAQVPAQRGTQPADNRSFLARALDGGEPATTARSTVRSLLGGGS